jgi:glycine oxidase
VKRDPGATVAIVGAGLIGLGIACELAKRGATVRVIDAHEPARAASWAGAGMLAPYTESVASPALEAFCVDSLARYPAFVADLRERGGVDARLKLDGIVDAAYAEADERRLRARARDLEARGIAARWLERDELRMHEPVFGSDVRGAMLCEAEGHVDNRRLGRALRAACDALGVRVDAGAGSVAVEADSRRVLGLRVPAGFVPADAVVNAAGAWAGELAGVPAHARVAVTPVKGQMLALAMPRGLVRRTLWVPGAYLVPRDDGRLLVGATVEAAGFDVRVTARGIRALLDAALAALPALGDLTVAETWAGLRPGSRDGLPYVGATALGGYYVAAGHYRNGILLAPATAVLVADMLEGRGDGVAAFSPQRDHEARAPVAK